VCGQQNSVPLHLLLEVAIGRVGSGSGSSQVSLTFWKKSDRVNLHVVFSSDL
jgi:hypothetical protein